MILKGDYDPSKKSGLKQLMEAALKVNKNMIPESLTGCNDTETGLSFQ